MLSCDINRTGMINRLMYTVFDKKTNHFIFDNNSHILVDFYNFCTIKNRNEYSMRVIYLLNGLMS